MSLREAFALFGLFWAQFILGAFLPQSAHGVERVAVGVLYLVLGVWIILRDRRRLPGLVRDAFRVSYEELGVERVPDAATNPSAPPE